jgi:hypothetical protein
MIHNIYPAGRKAICPVCSGLIQNYGGIFSCNDCQSRFEVVGFGTTENELIAKEIGGGVIE